jgi:hypothetical protein
MLADNPVVSQAPLNRYISILKSFLRFWLEFKTHDRSKKEIAVLGQWLKDNEAFFDVIKPNLTGQIIKMSKQD